MVHRVGDFLMSVWERKKEIFYGEKSACKVSQGDPTLECNVSGNNGVGS